MLQVELFSKTRSSISAQYITCHDPLYILPAKRRGPMAEPSSRNQSVSSRRQEDLQAITKENVPIQHNPDFRP